MEVLRRELGRWSSFRCGGFEIHGGKLAESAGDVELLELGNSGERRKTERARERQN